VKAALTPAAAFTAMALVGARQQAGMNTGLLTLRTSR